MIQCFFCCKSLFSFNTSTCVGVIVTMSQQLSIAAGVTDIGIDAFLMLEIPSEACAFMKWISINVCFFVDFSFSRCVVTTKYVSSSSPYTRDLVFLIS